MTRSYQKEQLLDLLKERSYRTDGPFILSSGATSPYFLDAKATVLNGRATRLVGSVLWDRAGRLFGHGANDGPVPLAVGGPEVGAIPLVALTVTVAAERRWNVEGFWVRAAAKDHGTRKRVEGRLAPGSAVVLVDDVCTTGGALAESARVVTALGCTVLGVVALVDRGAGAREVLAAAGVEHFEAVYALTDFTGAA